MYEPLLNGQKSKLKHLKESAKSLEFSKQKFAHLSDEEASFLYLFLPFKSTLNLSAVFLNCSEEKKFSNIKVS